MYETYALYGFVIITGRNAKPANQSALQKHYTK